MTIFQPMQDGSSSEHPSLDELNAFAVGQLPEIVSSQVEQHLAVCTWCNQQLESSPDDAFVHLLRQGDSLVRDGALAAVSPSRSLRFVPGYTLLELLGEGGMGSVWKARQDGLNRLVALKRLRSAGAPSAEALHRFRREAESVARLRHANIVPIYEVGEQDGEPYLALEYVGGGSLAAKLATGPLLPAQAASLVETLARAMHHAHEHGIIHRDLKPANILLDDNGAPKIGDFGLAKHLSEATAHTQTGAVLGTPSYMAPEQAGGDQATVGPPADVYALGAILYETLTGRPPFRGPDVLDTLAQVREREPVPPRQLQPNIPRDVQTICLKCLHKEQRRRYGSALELADDLRRFLAGEPIKARPVGRLERLLKWMRRKPTQAVLAALVVVVPLAVIAALVWHNEQQRRQIVRADTAEQNAQDNYAKARQTLISILDRLEKGSAVSTGNNPSQLYEGIAQDALAYVETALDQGDKSDPHVREDMARLLDLIGRIQAYHGRPEQARANFGKTLMLWEQLSREHPDVLSYRGSLGDCYRRLATLGGAETQRAEWLEKAIQVFEELGRLQPEEISHVVELSQCYQVRACLFFGQNRFAEAETHYQQAIRLFAQVIDSHPEQTGSKVGLASCCHNLGLVYGATRRLEMAESALRRADALLEPIKLDQGSGMEAVDLRSSVALNWGLLYLQMGQIDKALACYDRGISCNEAILQQDANYSLAREHAWKLHGAKAQAYDTGKRYAAAAAEWKHASEYAEGPTRLGLRMARSISLARGGDSARAAAEAETLAAEPGCAPDQFYNLACVLALSGRAEKAIALLSRLRGQGYFEKAENLKTLLTDTDLDSLRSREDFVKLTSGLPHKP